MENALKLPPRVYTSYFLRDETGWANLYGGVEMLATYSGMITSVPQGFEATWQHGVSLPWLYRRNPSNLLYDLKHPPNRLILVANADQKASLSSIGYTNVHAVGLPWIYAQPKAKPSRISGSILIMPPHTLDDAPFDEINQLSKYCGYVALKYQGNSALVCACVHMSCIRNGQFAQMFLDSGIKLITGADHHDRNSLIRMWQIFSQFDTVTTPVVGSHVFYALAAGCKVVIEGPKITYSRAQMLLDASYKRSIAVGFDPFLDSNTLVSEAKFERMFESPRADQDLGLEAVGMQAKKSPGQIKKILGWSRRKQVRQLLFMKARLFRNKLIQVRF